MLGDGALVQRVDLRHAGCIADVLGHRLEPVPGPSGEVDTGASVRKRARHGTADGPAGAVDQGGLVLQHHELLHIRVTAALADADTVTSSNWARPVRGSVGVRTEMSKQSER